MNAPAITVTLSERDLDIMLRALAFMVTAEEGLARRSRSTMGSSIVEVHSRAADEAHDLADRLRRRS